MILPGHLAAGYLAAHYAKLDERVAMVAAIFPDLVDKTGRYVLHVTPNGRVPMHAALSLLITTALIWLLTRQGPMAWAWAAGYASHLCMDVLTDIIQYGSGLDYLLWPFRAAVASRYSQIYGSIFDYVVWVFVAEGLVTAWGLAVFVLKRRRLQRPAAANDVTS
jgi:hypothetical protein